MGGVRSTRGDCEICLNCARFNCTIDGEGQIYFTGRLIRYSFNSAYNDWAKLDFRNPITLAPLIPKNASKSAEV